MITGTAVMQLVEKGVTSLDERMSPIVNRFIARTITTTKYTWRSLDDLFGPEINNVTLRHLLTMQSGIPDYDDGGLRGYQNDNPGVDIVPLDVLDICPKNFSCAPGSCGSYSSTNYVILGLVLAELSNATDWEAYDQRSIFNGNVVGKDNGDMIFAKHGPCSEYPRAAHGYQQPPPGLYDVYNMSCLGGWTCGNMVSPVQNVADFVYNLYGPPKAYVNQTTLDEMLNFNYLSVGDFPAWYGIGTMLLKYHWDNSTGSDIYHTDFVGHGGATYGFYAMSGYHYGHDFSLVLGTNMEYPVFQQNLFDIHDAIYAATISVMQLYSSGCKEDQDCRLHGDNTGYCKTNGACRCNEAAGFQGQFCTKSLKF